MWIWTVSTASAQWTHSNMLVAIVGEGEEKKGFWNKLAYPATMAKGMQSLGFYGEKIFLSDLTYYDFGWLSDIAGQPFQLRLFREGNTNFSSSSAFLAVSRKLSAEFSMGIRLGYSLITAKGYGNTGEPTAGLGAVFRLNSRLTWNFQADGINSFFALTGAGYFIRSGFGYMLSELASLSMEIVKEKGYPVNSIASFSYEFGEKVFGKIGYAFQLSNFYLSTGFQYAAMHIELSSTYHLSLGASAGLSIYYHFKPTE